MFIKKFLLLSFIFFSFLVEAQIPINRSVVMSHYHYFPKHRNEAMSFLDSTLRRWDKFKLVDSVIYRYEAEHKVSLHYAVKSYEKSRFVSYYTSLKLYDYLDSKYNTEFETIDSTDGNEKRPFQPYTWDSVMMSGLNALSIYLVNLSAAGKSHLEEIWANILPDSNSLSYTSYYFGTITDRQQSNFIDFVSDYFSALFYPEPNSPTRINSNSTTGNYNAYGSSIYHTTNLPQPMARRYAFLNIKVTNARDCEIFLNSNKLNETTDKKLVIPINSKEETITIKVTKDGYLPFTQTAQVRDGDTTEILAELRGK